MVFLHHIRRALSGLGLLAGITLAATIANTAKADHPCVPEWQAFTSGGQTGVSGTVIANTVWNGELIAAGTFETAGGQTVNRIARWDGSEWHPFTSGGEIGVNGGVLEVNAVTVWNGDLIAAGIFLTAGGQIVRNIARWDGSEWHPFTSGGQIGLGVNFPSERVHALTVYNGDLIAGGDFVTAGGQDVNYIARWDGSAWYPLTSGGQSGVGPITLTNTRVRALTVYDGDLIVGGRFNTAGGQTVNNIASWDGTQWHPFIAGGQTGVGGASLDSVNALTIYDGDLIAGGEFATAGGQTVNRIARWDGSTGQWHPLISGGQIGVSGGATSSVRALSVWNGNLIAGGFFTTAGGVTVDGIARWNGSSWHPLIVGCDLVGINGWVLALTVYDGDITIGGSISTAGDGQTVNSIAAWQACPYRGVCCVNGAIIDVFADECDAIGGVFFGEGVAPEDVECDPGSPPCPGDLNGDGVVDVSDLLELLSNWGICP